MKTSFGLRLSKEQWLDYGLLLASLLCFAAYGYGVWQLKASNAEQAYVGTLSQGNVSYREAHSNVYSQIGPGAKLYSPDVIWTGNTDQTEIELKDRSRLTLGKRSLVVLKKSFTGVWTPNSNRLEVVQGDVRFSSSLHPIISSNPVGSLVEQVENPAQTKPDLDLLINPKPYVQLYYRDPSVVEVPFSWPQPVRGTLVIHSRAQKGLRFFQVDGQRSITLPLTQDATYFWEIVDSDKKTLVGPYKFDLHVLTADLTQKLLKETKFPPEGQIIPIEVHW